MEETQIVTESQEVEPQGTASEVTTNVDELSDEEFAQAFDEPADVTPAEDPDKKVDETADDTDLNSLYRKQLDDVDAKLDRPVLIKVDGEVIELNTVNELRDMAERGTAVTKRFQKLAADRKVLEAQLEALGEVPSVEPANEIDDIAQEILDSDYADTFRDDVSKLPADVKTMLSGDAQILRALSVDYASGFAQKIMPQVRRSMTVNGMSFKEAYTAAGAQYYNSKRKSEDSIKTLSSQPKQNTSQFSEPDVSSMSDDEFEKYFDNL
jgi:hypothetical protein